MDWQTVVGAMLGALAAGVINILAGNGSSITLYLLMDEFHLPPDVANATNRVGIITQGATSTAEYARKGVLDFRSERWSYFWIFLGAMIGLALALWVSAEQFRAVFKYLLLSTLVTILVRPERWLRADASQQTALSWWVRAPVFLLLGIYGGFIQMGMNVFLTMFLVLGAHYSLPRANVFKNMSTFLYTIVAVGLFAALGRIDWGVGAILAVGQGLGGWIGARFATSYKNAHVWMYRLLVLSVLWAIARAFNLI